MGFIDALNHLLNFAAPALGLAALMALAGWAFGRKMPMAVSSITQLAINIVVGLVVLTAGLWYFGRDGMVATYALLVVCMATCQWVMARGWRA